MYLSLFFIAQILVVQEMGQKFTDLYNLIIYSCIQTSRKLPY